MVLVALHHADRSVEERVRPRRVRRQRPVGVVLHPVRFDVGLVDDVEPVLVGQLVPARIVGVVAGAHGVDVEPLHQLDVAQHVLLADDVAGARLVLVAVDALDGDRDAVHQQLPVLQLHPPEPHPGRQHLRDCARGIGEREGERVEAGRLGRPLVRVADGQPELDRRLFAGAQVDGADRVPL